MDETTIDLVGGANFFFIMKKIIMSLSNVINATRYDVRIDCLENNVSNHEMRQGFQQESNYTLFSIETWFVN